MQVKTFGASFRIELVKRVAVMRRTSRLVFGLVFTLLAHQSALAVEPDNQPWDKIDRVLNVEMHIAGECLIESLRFTA